MKALCVVLALAASAQTQALTILAPPRPVASGSFLPAPLANAFLRQIADCLVQSDLGHVNGLFSTVPGSYDEERVFYAMDARSGQCSKSIDLSKSIRYDPLALRGALAEALYQNRLGVRIRTPQSGSMTSGTSASNANGRVALREFAVCVVSQDAHDSELLLAKSYRSPDENTALQALRPAMAYCIGSDRSLKTDRMTLRGIIAEQLIAVRATASVGNVNSLAQAASVK